MDRVEVSVMEKALVRMDPRLTSESGARNIGPKARPKTYKLRPSVVTSALVSKSFWNFFWAGEKQDAPHDTERSMR